MGFISRKVLPACGNMCVCCPALRPSSRQPVKRYKKLLGDIFPKSPGGPPNERKIIKLCEYAARNPFRVPKIAKFLEQRSYKELRSEHINFIKIIMEVYSKLLCICKEQMAYFATSLLNVIIGLLDNKQQDAIRIIGCQTLTTFIYSQADCTYAHDIEALVNQVCVLACGENEDCSKRCLRAASLQCLSAMVWFMSAFSHIFSDIPEIVQTALENYKADDICSDGSAEQVSHHHWVEVVRSDVRDINGVGNDNAKSIHFRSRSEIKDTSEMSRDEIENPEVWAQICIKRLAEMAKESTTLRRILDPLFTFFDSRKQWDPVRGLAVVVLSDMIDFTKCLGNELVIVAAIIRHLDHKNVVHDPQMKSDIIQVTTGLIRLLKSQTKVAEIGIVSDLCKHLRKSLQATVGLVGLDESNWNTALQNSIEDCLIEISKSINDAQPLFDMITITLEELPAVGNVAKATVGSLLILAHIISSSSFYSHIQVFPESVFLQILKTMMHPDVETRIGAHQLFSSLLIRTVNQQRIGGVYFHLKHLYESRRGQSGSASVAALLERLRREKECGNVDKMPVDAHEDNKEKETIDDERKHNWARKNSPNVYKISCSIIDKVPCSTSSTEAEPDIVLLSDEQNAQLLSAFWIQANQPDNLPSNFEAIANSYNLTILSVRLKHSSHHDVVRIFQLPLSLRNLSLFSDGIISPPYQRSLFTLSIAMLMFAGRTYHIPELCTTLKSLINKYVDPFLSIGDDCQIFVRPQVDLKDYGCDTDKQCALITILNMRKAVNELDQHLLPSIAQTLPNLTNLDVDSVMKILSDNFTPDDGLLFGPNSILDWFHNRPATLPDGSFCFDEGSSRCSSMDGDSVGESPAPELCHFISKGANLTSMPSVISVGQLLESALQVAGQVAGATVSTSPLPYGMMASQCEALGMGSRKKLSSWLGNSNDFSPMVQLSTLAVGKQVGVRKANFNECELEGPLASDHWQTVRLPPASPFDNFLKAAHN